MKFLKNNLKLIIGILIGAILASGIVYAATSASQVTYTTNKNAEIKTVEGALNDLYSKTLDGENIYDSKIYCGTQGTGGEKNITFSNIEEGSYYLYMCGGRARDGVRAIDPYIKNLTNVTIEQNFSKFGNYIFKCKIISEGNGSLDFSCYEFSEYYIYYMWITKI